jgi:hypothetical protein
MPSATSRSIEGDFTLPEIYRAPSDDSPRAPRPLGALERHPASATCIVHMSEDITRDEQALDFSLVMVVGGARPPVTTAEVNQWLERHYAMPGASVTTKHYHPEDFLISFSSYGDMAHVLHHPPPTPTLVLVFKRWRQQLHAIAGKLLFQVVVRIRGIPVHAWHPATARQILSPSCACIQPTASTVAKSNLRWYVGTRFVPGVLMQTLFQLNPGFTFLSQRVFIVGTAFIPEP